MDFQPYENLVELVHQAMKAERQVAEELKYVKAKSFFAAKASSSTQPMVQVHAQGNVKGSTPQPPTTSKKTTPSPQAAKSYVTCYKCGGQGHKSFECTNKKVMIVNDNGDYESMSEDEYHALNKVATMQSLDEDDDYIYCDGDPNPTLVVTRVLTTINQGDDAQRCNLFQTKAGINGKSIKVIIDGEIGRASCRERV